MLRLYGQNSELKQELKNQMQHGVIVIFCDPALGQTQQLRQNHKVILRHS